MTARDQLYYDIFVTALEGGIGYWSKALSYHHWNVVANTDDVFGFYSDIVEFGDDDPGEDGLPRHRIDRSVIARGYALAAGEWRHKINWSSGERPPLIIFDDVDWDFDAGDADAIVQLGLGLIDTIRSGPDEGRRVIRYG